MRSPRTPAVMTLGVAVATVTSALALGGPSAGQAPGGTTDRKADAKDAPAPRAKGIVTKQFIPAPGAVPGPPVIVKRAPVPANVDAMARRYTQQFRPILRAEYHIVLAVCRPTPDQRRAIARDAERTLREAARRYAEQAQRPMRAEQRSATSGRSSSSRTVPAQRPMRAEQRSAVDPRKGIREGLAASVKVRLSAEMAERYREELARRDAGGKPITVRNLVARLDGDLVLGPDQRRKIEESLIAHWEDAWCPSPESLMHDNNILPPIPDRYVVPHLNEAQATIWRGMPKGMVFYGGLGMMGGIRVDDPLEDEELRIARMEAARDDPKPDPNGPQPMMIQDAFIQVAPAPAPAKTTTRIRVAPAKPGRPADAARPEAVPKR